MTARLGAIAALFLAAFPTILLGQTSEEYAAMGQKLWAAFECGALAEYADMPDESRRLYNPGYDQGNFSLRGRIAFLNTATDRRSAIFRPG
jgi:hypothetical protein